MTVIQNFVYLKKIEKERKVKPIDFHQLAGMVELEFTNYIKELLKEQV